MSYQNIFTRLNLKNHITFILIILSIISFFVGYILRENLGGGGRIDLDHEWKNYTLLKNNIFAFLYGNYEASRFPLFHIINIFINKFIKTQQDYVLSFFIYSFLLPLFFFVALKKVFHEIKIQHLLIFISILLLSPYFRTSSYWGLQENLSYIFFILSIYLNENFKKNIYLILFFAFCAFYADQKFLFVPLLFLIKFFYIDKKFKKINEKFKILSYCFILTIPSLIIFYLWEGVTPKVTSSGINEEGFYPQNIVYVTNIISLYLFPFLLVNFNKNLLYKIYNLKFIVFFILCTIIIYLSYRFYFKTDLISGGGWLYKIYQFLLIKNIYLAEIYFFLAFTISLFIVVIYYKIMEKSFVNIFLLFFLYFIGIFITVTFQEYYDPLMFFLLIFFFEKKNIYKYDTSHFMIIFLYFFSFFTLTYVYRLYLT